MNENDPRFIHLNNENNFDGANDMGDGAINATTVENSVKEKSMNETKLDEIQERIIHLLDNARNASNGFSLVDGRKILNKNLEEYNALIGMIEIINDNTRENGVPFIGVEGTIIKENRSEEYYNLLEKTALSPNAILIDEPEQKNNNEIELQKIQERMDEIIEKANNSTSGFSLASDGETKVMSEDLLEYNTLLNLSEILKDNSTEFPDVIVDGLTIKENKKLDYYKARGILDGIEIEKSKNNSIETLDNTINSENVNNEVIEKMKEASDEIQRINNNEGPLLLSGAVQDELSNEDSNAIEENENTNDSIVKGNIELIPGTNIPKPRRKGNTESYEDYENYLKEHYKPYGIGTEEVEYYPGTEIPKPRGKYPHEILDGVNATDPYYNDMLNYFANVYTKENTKKPEPTEVTGIRKATNFLKKHKKKIIVALGLTALAAAFVPSVIPSIMYSNSVLWHHVPASIGKILHGCNSILSSFVGATEVSSGLWAIGGNAINAGSATGSLLGALGVSALTFAGSASILSTINIAKEKVMNVYKKHKEKKANKAKQIEVTKTNEVKPEEIVSDKTNEATKEKAVESILNKINEKTDELEAKGLMYNDEYDFLDEVEQKRNDYISIMPKVHIQDQIEVQKNINELNRINTIITNGKNTSIKDTIDFAGYRINPNDKNELESLLQKYDIKYNLKTDTKEENKDTSKAEQIEKLKEQRDSLLNIEDEPELERGIK